MARRSELPKFSPEAYDTWRFVLEMHIYSQHEEMCSIMRDGPPKIEKPNPASGEGEPLMIEKPMSEWSVEDKRRK